MTTNYLRRKKNRIKKNKCLWKIFRVRWVVFWIVTVSLPSGLIEKGLFWLRCLTTLVCTLFQSKQINLHWWSLEKINFFVVFMRFWQYQGGNLENESSKFFRWNILQGPNSQNQKLFIFSWFYKNAKLTILTLFYMSGLKRRWIFQKRFQNTCSLQII